MPVESKEDLIIYHMEKKREKIVEHSSLQDRKFPKRNRKTIFIRSLMDLCIQKKF